MQDFFENLLRYLRYFVSLILGIFFALFERLRPLLKNPLNVIALVGILTGGFAFIFFTLRAMLGLTPL